MQVIDGQQRTAEWDADRLGIPTSSAFDKILTPGGKLSGQREGYLYTLAAQRLMGRKEETFSSFAMEEGVRREEESRNVYEMLTETDVRQVRFCVEDGGRWGCSPDGLVGDDGMVELKNPLGKTLVGYWDKGDISQAYWFQIQGQLFVTGREWCDFMAYCPGLPTMIVRIKPSPDVHKAIETALIAFCDELDELCKKIGGA